MEICLIDFDEYGRFLLNACLYKKFLLDIFESMEMFRKKLKHLLIQSGFYIIDEYCELLAY